MADIAKTQRLLRIWMASEVGRDEEIKETVSDISNGETTLLSIVKALGEYLTSEEGAVRTKGVDFLSSVLTHCPVDKFNRQSARVLVSFYCGKLDDSETMIPSLKGLISLSALPTVTSNDAIAIIQAIFGHVRMNALVQSSRYLVFTIVDTLMAHHRETLKRMEGAFLEGYIRLAEGEKDPRNLLIAFAIAHVILIEFDISGHLEPLFNITFCYFPITFRPPPNDPYGITTDDLKVALRGCLNATPAFGPMAIPVFLEKLTAGSPKTKQDTLQAMSACLPIYGSALARTAGRKLWNSLKLEIFQPTDLITEEEALKTAQALIKAIYANEDQEAYSKEDIQGLAKEACEECVHILREPEKSQAKSAIKILCGFMSTTSSVSRYTASQVIPYLVKLFLDQGEAFNRPSILLHLCDLISAARDSVLEEPAVLLWPYKDAILGVVTVGLKSAASRRFAIQGLMGLVTTKKLLTDDELCFIVHNINEILQPHLDDTDDTSDAALELLLTISLSTPRHLQEQTLPLLFGSLPDQAPPRGASIERAKYWQALSALGKLCLQPELFEVFIIRLTTKLDLICMSAGNISQEAESEPSAAYAHCILNTIANTLDTKVDKGHPDVAKYIERLVPRIYNLFIYSALPSDNYRVFTDPRLIKVAARIITLVTQTLSVKGQENFATALFSAYLTGDTTRITQGHQRIVADGSFLPFNDSAPSSQKNLVALFTAAVVTLHKEIRIPVPDLNNFLNMVLGWGLMAGNILQTDSAWQLVSSVLNKHADDVPSFLQDKLDHYWPLKIGDAGVALKRRQQAIKSWIWVSKALLVRNHPFCMQFTDRLFDVFDDESISWDAARAFGEICNTDAVVIKRNHAVIKILYVQKFVNSVIPRIIKGAKDPTKPRQQTAYLVALTSLVKSIPKMLYAHEMPSLIPLLLRGLDLPDADIRANVIDTFLKATEGDSPDQDIVSEHGSTLVSAMLKNCMVHEMPSMRVRIAALKYLGVLPNIVRYNVLHPSKSNVIRELAKVLDDPSRSVRKEAVDARTNWFKYNG